MAAVRDIMQTNVVTIRMDESARALARLLADSEISGVPVLDAHDKVVGVASTTDLVRLAAGDMDVSLVTATVAARLDRSAELSEEDLDEALEVDPYGFFLPEDSPLRGSEVLGDLPESRFDEMTVEDVMTPVSFSVTPDMSVQELCDYLVRGRIHRALVVDDGDLLGIVTSQDVLRAVATAAVPI